MGPIMGCRSWDPNMVMLLGNVWKTDPVLALIGNCFMGYHIVRDGEKVFFTCSNCSVLFLVYC